MHKKPFFVIYFFLISVTLSIFSAEADLNNRNLLAATLNQEVLTVNELLGQGANIDQQDQSGHSALHLATDPFLMNLLLTSNANPNLQDKKGNTPLHIAAMRNRKKCMKLLLAAGANPDMQNIVHGDTPLHLAIRKENIEVIKLLLESNADPLLCNNDNTPPAELAHDTNSPDIQGLFSIAKTKSALKR